MGFFRQIIAALLRPYRVLTSPRSTSSASQSAGEKRKRDISEDSKTSTNSGRSKKRRKHDYMTPAKQIITDDALINHDSEEESTALDSDTLQTIAKQREERQRKRQLDMDSSMDDISDDLSRISLESDDIDMADYDEDAAEDAEDEVDGYTTDSNDNESYAEDDDDQIGTDNEEEEQDIPEDADSEDEEPSQHTLGEDSFLTNEEADFEANTTPRHRGPHRVVPLDGSPDKQVIDDLRKDGWNETHLDLVNHLVNRGHEAVMPLSWRFPFSYMPRNLFAEDDEAMLAMRKSPQLHGEIAFSRLLYLAGSIRSTVKPGQISDGEKFTKRLVTEYIKAITRDTGLYKQRVLPLVHLSLGPETMDSRDLAAKAQRSLNKLATKWTAAFEERGIDRPVPNLYAIVGSGPRIAVVVRRQSNPEGGLQLVLMLDFEQPDLDFWSVLALAMVVCHNRDQQIILSEETGIGQRQPEDVDPPDIDL